MVTKNTPSKPEAVNRFLQPLNNNVASASPATRRVKDRTLHEIEKLKRQRESRRKSAEEFKRKRADEIKENERRGRPGDVDFQRMIREFRDCELEPAKPHGSSGDLKINVVVRKRPINELERSRRDYDSVTCNNPNVHVHHCKFKVDGITKYLDNTNFHLDHAFDENCTNEVVYEHTAKSLVAFALNGGRATCFAYGQTGSGKTYTMAGVQSIAATNVFKLIQSREHRRKNLEVHCAFFELYGGRCIDLLHDKKVCAVREDGKGRVQVEGLHEIVVHNMEELIELIERGNRDRTTHATEMNDVSSRSHAICQIALRQIGRTKGEPYGKLSLIDLAGSERGQDTKHHNRQRRTESAEINKSLLALKECIRALGNGEKHVPYRGSKLTMVLKDSFSSDSRTVMISCISPAASSADHTLNTLRYADRVKEKKVGERDRTSRAASYGSSRRQSNVYFATPADLDSETGATETVETLPKSRRRQSQAPPPPPIHSASIPEEKSDADRSHSSFEKTATRSNSTVAKTMQPARPSKVMDESELERKNNNMFDPASLQKQKAVEIPEVSKSESESKRDSAGAPGTMSFHDVVAALVDEEEALLHQHMQAIEENADLLTQEGELLAKVQGQDVIDYDIDEYAAKLDDILTTKLATFQKLHRMLKTFRKHLALEEVTTQAING